MEQSYPIPTQDYTVFVLCMTYNHEEYIEDAIKGFVMQKTTFPFVALIIDDASTDNTAKIIRDYENKYPDIIKGVYLKENHYSKGKSKESYIKPWRDRSKYEALCEGDDYWIDPMKLQKQVDILENYPECGMVYGKVKEYIQENQLFNKKTFGYKIGSTDQLLIQNTIATPTVLFKTEFVDKYYKEIKPERKWLLGDWPLWIYISLQSKVYFSEDVFAVYRILPNSASHSSSIKKRETFLNSTYDMKLYFSDKYNISSRSIIENQRYHNLMSNAIEYNDRTLAIKYYKQMSYHPIKVKIKYIICLLNLIPLYKSFQKITLAF